jgi:hypothetical protein
MGIRLESQIAPPSSSSSSSSTMEGNEGKSITVIKEICKDTLAEKDGRLRAGDRVLMVICYSMKLLVKFINSTSIVRVIPFRLTTRLLIHELLTR